MKRQIAIGLGSLLIAGSAQAATVYGVDGSNNLVTFNSSAPGSFTSSVKITGTSGTISSLDIRPINNVLYGFGSDRVIYTINAGTGVATAVSGVLDLGPMSTQFAFDFNPTIDRLRIITDANNNFVFNPNNGALTVATPVFYAPGDPNVGNDPNVTAVAYTSSFFGAPGTSTQLYGIDTVNDVLTRVANSAGQLDTVGSLGFDLGPNVSFDILGSLSYVSDGSGFYSLDLGSGALTKLGETGAPLFGLAVANVPEPATWAMLIGGFGFVGAVMRRRRQALFAVA